MRHDGSLAPRPAASPAAGPRVNRNTGGPTAGRGEQVPSANYTEARLATLYDALNPPGAHTEFYLGLPGPLPRRILDVGCGTGLLACELAARGHEVAGADPAAAMLAVARHRPGGSRVRWIQADAAGLSVRTRFDLILMTGHVFQLLLDDEDVAGALRVLRRHLASGGRIVLETRNPAAREWQFWTPEETRRRVSTPDGTAEIHYDIQSVAGDRVTYETWFRFPGGTSVVPDTLRFMSQAELAAFLDGAGLAAAAWYGDWDRSPAGPASPEIIAVAQADDTAGRTPGEDGSHAAGPRDEPADRRQPAGTGRRAGAAGPEPGRHRRRLGRAPRAGRRRAVLPRPAAALGLRLTRPRSPACPSARPWPGRRPRRGTVSGCGPAAG